MRTGLVIGRLAFLALAGCRREEPAPLKYSGLDELKAAAAADSTIVKPGASTAIRSA